MPVSFLSNEQRESYGRFTGAPSPDDLARYFHLDDSDHALIAQKRGAHNRLGFAVQLGTLRYLGTFLESPLAVPAPVLHTLAKQLRIAAIPDAHLYSASRQRLQHAAEIQTHYGYVEITERQIGFHLTRWLYALCWTGTDRPTVLFERAVTWLVTHKVLLPGSSTLERYIARLRSRVEERLWLALGRGISSEQQGRLESLLLVPVGSRSSPLDHLRKGPVAVSSRSLIVALMRLHSVRELGIRLPAAARISRQPVWRPWPGLQVPPRSAPSCACRIRAAWPRWSPSCIAWKPARRTMPWKCWRRSCVRCSATPSRRTRRRACAR
jgi:hypothetical protein